MLAAPVRTRKNVTEPAEVTAGTSHHEAPQGGNKRKWLPGGNMASGSLLGAAGGGRDLEGGRDAVITLLPVARAGSSEARGERGQRVRPSQPAARSSGQSPQWRKSSPRKGTACLQRGG